MDAALPPWLNRKQQPIAYRPGVKRVKMQIRDLQPPARRFDLGKKESIDPAARGSKAQIAQGKARRDSKTAFEIAMPVLSRKASAQARRSLRQDFLHRNHIGIHSLNDGCGSAGVAISNIHVVSADLEHRRVMRPRTEAGGRFPRRCGTPSKPEAKQRQDEDAKSHGAAPTFSSAGFLRTFSLGDTACRF
jgi:hypothetical protein